MFDESDIFRCEDDTPIVSSGNSVKVSSGTLGNGIQEEDCKVGKVIILSVGEQTEDFELDELIVKD